MDITTVWSVPDGRGDWILAGAALQSGDDLVTASYISLFTDRIANADDKIPDRTGNPRGWCGDQGQDVPIGSRLWLLDRAKQTNQVLNDARDYVAEALQWMIDDRVVDHFDITVEFTRPSMLGIKVIAYRQGREPKPMDFAWAWQGIS